MGEKLVGGLLGLRARGARVARVAYWVGLLLAVGTVAVTAEPSEVILVRFQLATFEPYTTIAREVVENLNRNGCVLLVEAPDAPTVMATYRMGSTEFTGMTCSFPPGAVMWINESTLAWADDSGNHFYRRHALCHEFLHRVKIAAFGWDVGGEHPEDDTSCLDRDWTSAYPSVADVAQLAARCQ